MKAKFTVKTNDMYTIFVLCCFVVLRAGGREGGRAGEREGSRAGERVGWLMARMHTLCVIMEMHLYIRFNEG